MAHELKLSKDGTRFRLNIGFSGASLDADLNATRSQWQVLKNVLANRPGPLVKRGAIPQSVFVSSADGSMRFYNGTLKGTDVYQPYVGIRFSGGSVIVTTSAAGNSSSIEIGAYVFSATAAVPYGKSPMISDSLVWAGYQGGGAGVGLPGLVGQYSGNSFASTGTGTVTVANGSATVVGAGTAFTSAMVGAFFRTNISGSGFSDAFSYKIIKVNSATSITLDRNWVGVGAAGKAYEISSTMEYMVGVGVFVEAIYAPPAPAPRTYLYAGVAGNAWGRFLVADFFENYDPNISVTVQPDTRKRSRLRWSGLIDSQEGLTAPFLGQFGFHPNGYLDIPVDSGAITGLANFGNAVMVFSDRSIHIIYGSPTFEDVGSLDASTVYHGYNVSPNTWCETPYGVYFYDTVRGLCLWNGSGAPKIVSGPDILRTVQAVAPTTIGYYNEHLFMFGGLSATRALMYHIPRNGWTEITGKVNLIDAQPGRSQGVAIASDHYLVAYSGRTVVNVANILDNPGVEPRDFAQAGLPDSGTLFTVTAKTGNIGDLADSLRPERMFLTYRAVDVSSPYTPANPEVLAFLNSGLPDSSPTFSSPTSFFDETTNVETRVLEVGMDRGQTIKADIRQDNAAGKFELYGLTIVGTNEGVEPNV